MAQTAMAQGQEIHVPIPENWTAPDQEYRYVVGEYQGIQAAMDALPKIKQLGYKDAFIMNVNHYRKLSVIGDR